ncbi:MAG: IclR family transcriptional regulator [Hyphomicrobiaceae bacterium]|nr:IclR family transcriptional regulator [Hyphomicrobiaceae bacterium]
MLEKADRTGSAEHGSALEKAFVVLDEVTRSAGPVSLADLVDRIGLPRQTIHRVLQQLTDANLIMRAPKKDRYIIGPALTRLSVDALTSPCRLTTVRAALRPLVDATGETCNVGILDQDEVVYIERMDGHSPLRLQLQVGSRVPFHCTAIGKLLVANLHKNVRTRMLNVQPLKRFTGATLTGPDTLEAEFTRIRSNGYSFNNEEFVDGLTAVATAVSDGRGKSVAGVAIHAPSTRMDEAKAVALLPQLRKAAEQISDVWAAADG